MKNEMIPEVIEVSMSSKLALLVLCGIFIFIKSSSIEKGLAGDKTWGGALNYGIR